MFQNTLRHTIITGLLTILFIPFLVSNTLFFPFITSKAFVFRLIVEVIFGLWIILAALNPQYRPKKSIFLYAFTAFIAIVGIADFFGVNPVRSFWSNFERMEGYITLLHVYGYFLVASTVLSTEQLWKSFWNTSLVASVFMCLYGFLQLSGAITINQGGARLDGTFGNAVYLAVYMLFHIFIATMFFVREKTSTFMRFVYGIVICMQVVVLFYTATRGTILGLLGGALVTTILIALFETQRPRLRKSAIAILVTLVVIIGGFILVKDSSVIRSQPVLGRFASISFSETTTKSRFMIWNMAIKGFKERPVLGWGQENFNLIFNKYYDPRMYNQEQWFDRAHSVFFDWLINAGILGLLGYLSLFAATLYVLWKNNVTFSFVQKSILTGLLVGYFIHNIFVFDNLFSYVFFFAVIAYICERTGSGDQVMKDVHVPIETVRYLILPASIILTIVVMMAVNKDAYYANRTLLQAISVVGIQNDNPVSCVQVVNQGGKNVCSKAEPTIELYKKALSYKTVGIPEIREQLIISTASVQQMNISSEAKMAYYEYAFAEGKNLEKENPNDARYYFLNGAYLANLGFIDLGLADIQKAVALSPTKQAMLLTEGKILLVKKDFAKAAEIFKKAYELEKNNDEAKKRYIEALLLAGRTAEAKLLSQ